MMDDIKSAILHLHLVARDLSEDSLVAYYTGQGFHREQAERKMLQIEEAIERYRKAKRESKS